MNKVIPIDHARGKEQLNPADLDDFAAADMFLSMSGHPAYMALASDQFAAWVNRQLGDRARDDLSDGDAEWRQRFAKFMVDVDGYDSGELDALLDSDPYLQAIYDWLRETRERAAELSEERAALLALRGLRAAVDVEPALERLRDDERWGLVIRKLGMTAFQE